MKKSLFICPFLLCVFFIMLTDCSTQSLIETKKASNENYIRTLLLDRSSNQITVEQAANVARLFRYGIEATKSPDSGIRNVLTVAANGDEAPLFYIVNYNNGRGYVVISASRKYYPILGYSKTGSVDNSYNQYGMDVCFSEYVSDIIALEAGEPLMNQRVASTLWNKYEQTETKIQTKDGDPINSFRDSCINVWENQGYSCYSLAEMSEILPDSVYDAWCEIAEDQGNPDYDYLHFSIVLVDEDVINSNNGPLLMTTWHQGPPYNDSIPISGGNHQPVGCANIAAGQIMKYHEWPSSIAWSAMPYQAQSGYSYPVLSSFLYHLALNTNTHFDPSGSGADIDDVRSALVNTYSYNATKVAHSQQYVYPSIMQYSRPVFMGGYRYDTLTQGYKGHAWVCDGVSSNSTTTSYTLMILSPSLPFYYDTVGAPYYDYLSYTYYHMNWGRTDLSNGWFLDGLAPSSYVYNREDLVNIYPL